MARPMIRPLVVATLLSASAAPVHASELVTKVTRSGCVVPAKTPGNRPPPGNPPAPAEDLAVNVLLPDGYDATRAYRVLYLLHGSGGAFDYWAHPTKGDVAKVAAGVQAIVVMPEGRQGFYADWWDGGTRGANGRCWETYHLRELVPQVERWFRIAPGCRSHAIAGLSMGGLGALYYATQLPGYFGTVASFSPPASILQPEWSTIFENAEAKDPAQIWGDRDAQAFYWEGHDPAYLAANLRHTRVMLRIGDGVPHTTELDPDRSDPSSVAFDTGTEAYLRSVAPRFVDAARAAGVDLTYVPQPGIHQWPLWRDDLAAAIRWGLFGGVAEQPPAWSFKTVARRGRAWDLRFEFADAPGVVATLHRDGDVLVVVGAGRVKITPGCGPSFTATVPFTRRLPDCPMRLRVSPRRPPAGVPTAFRFRASAIVDGRRQPLEAVQIRFAGRTLTTGRSGSARTIARVRSAGRLVARATREGFSAARAVVRAGPAG